MYEDILKDLKSGLNSAVDHLENEFTSIIAGRANPKMLEGIKVDYYGNPTPLNQMANITVPDPKMLVVSVWDKSALKDVIKAINDANLGVNVSDDGNIIRVVFPALTTERREQFVKQAKKMAENARITIRNERRDTKDKLKKLKDENSMSEDDLKVAEDKMQKEVDAATKKVDEIYKQKEKEILGL